MKTNPSEDLQLVQIVNAAEKELACNCDLDNWEPEISTGHSWVCRIHKLAMSKWDDLQRGGRLVIIPVK